MTPRRRAVTPLLALLLAACLASPSPSPSLSPSPAATSAPPTPTESPGSPSPGSPSPSASPTATPEPPLSLPLPEGIDGRVVTATVTPDVGDTGGTLMITVVSGTDTRIDELVLRWSTELEATMRLAPFAPSEQRISDTSPPLVQDWTKWVFGPGEQGEPDGTISVGWGPLFPGATLQIPLLVTRNASGPVAFDLQMLAGNDLLAFNGDEPAEIRVEVP